MSSPAPPPRNIVADPGKVTVEHQIVAIAQADGDVLFVVGAQVMFTYRCPSCLNPARRRPYTHVVVRPANKRVSPYH